MSVGSAQAKILRGAVRVQIALRLASDDAATREGELDAGSGFPVNRRRRCRSDPLNEASRRRPRLAGRADPVRHVPGG